MEGQRFWFTITWSFVVQTLKIFTDAYTSCFVRGQSTLKDVIERYFWSELGRECLKNVHLLKKAKSEIWNQIACTLCNLLNNTTTVRLKNETLNGCKLLVKLATKYRNGSDL